MRAPIVVCIAIVIIASTGLARGSEATTEVTKAIKQTLHDCSEENQKLLPGFVTRVDALGNGPRDYLVDYSKVDCRDGGGLFFCGTGGCTTQVFVQLEDGSYLKVLDDTVQGVDFAEKDGVPTMVIRLHGSACGKVGSEPCSETLYWNGTQFTAAH